MREALWGGPGFDQRSFFYQHIAQIGALRRRLPALRYGRFYFRPVSGDGRTFAITTFTRGVLAFSRILDAQEILIAANTNTDPGQDQVVRIIVDDALNGVGTAFRVLYSNKVRPTAPGRVERAGSVTVHEADGSSGSGPVNALEVTLQPLEVQILGQGS